MYKVLAFYIVSYNSRVISYLFCSPARFLLVRIFTSLRFTIRFRVCHHPSDYMAQHQPLSRARGTEWRPACWTSSVWRAIRNSVPNPSPHKHCCSRYTSGRERSKFPDTREHPLLPPATKATVLTVKCDKSNGQSSYCPILQWHMFWQSPYIQVRH
jgi:hypothetical protein